MAQRINFLQTNEFHLVYHGIVQNRLLITNNINFLYFTDLVLDAWNVQNTFVFLILVYKS